MFALFAPNASKSAWNVENRSFGIHLNLSINTQCLRIIVLPHIQGIRHGQWAACQQHDTLHRHRLLLIPLWPQQLRTQPTIQ
jgi:hypothetical protein